jgi:hypothetical protein
MVSINIYIVIKILAIILIAEILQHYLVLRFPFYEELIIPLNFKTKFKNVKFFFISSYPPIWGKQVEKSEGTEETEETKEKEESKKSEETEKTEETEARSEIKVVYDFEDN